MCLCALSKYVSVPVFPRLWKAPFPVFYNNKYKATSAHMVYGKEVNFDKRFKR